jgi:adenylate cyclase
VPRELVDELAARPGRVSLEGESRRMSVLFADIHGFASIAESLDPRELPRLMNQFLTRMTRVIQRHRGTIDKYMGDSVMAFWGAPLEDTRHAGNATLAALAMQREMRELNRQFGDCGWPELRLGIGINTGVMSVGNMGSEFRMAYTVMGDAVNLGARLEGLTRVYGVDIIVSQFTREAVERALAAITTNGHASFRHLGLDPLVTDHRRARWRRTPRPATWSAGTRPARGTPG